VTVANPGIIACTVLVVASENSNPEGVPGTNGVKVILREGLSPEGPRP
jgi:hypothetical protein